MNEHLLKHFLVVNRCVGNKKTVYMGEYIMMNFPVIAILAGFTYCEWIETLHAITLHNQAVGMKARKSGQVKVTAPNPLHEHVFVNDVAGHHHCSSNIRNSRRKAKATPLQLLLRNDFMSYLGCLSSKREKSQVLGCSQVAGIVREVQVLVFD
eukprot:TRINITY_DN301_c0_g2_i1.p3 TRINITY_DN301_c0_g2~~TRINITY_DN301_c0_g2_i1.p3  ORF type:complete len:153 (-),score=4.16 TRINITY_DN301_c0_g2_i1:772-1230(-)